MLSKETDPVSALTTMAAKNKTKEKKRDRSVIEDGATPEPSKRKGTFKGIKPFARAAFNLFTDLHNNHSDVARWSETGEMIIILDKDAFVNHLPRFFNTNQFESFSKQLNVYGFKKIGPEWEVVNGAPVLIDRSTPTPGVRHNENHYRFWHPHFRHNLMERLYLVLPESRPAKQTSQKVVNKPEISNGTPSDEEDYEHREELKEKVKSLKAQIEEMENKMKRKFEALQHRYKNGVNVLSKELERVCAQRIVALASSPINSEVIDIPQPSVRYASIPHSPEPEELDHFSESEDMEHFPEPEEIKHFPEPEEINYFPEPEVINYFPEPEESNHFPEPEETDAPAALLRAWSNPRSDINDFCVALPESPFPDWPPPDNNHVGGRTTTFELSEPFLFQEAGLNDYRITFNAFEHSFDS